MSELRPEIIGRVYMYPSTQGGKKRPIRGIQFGCPLAFEGKMYDCRILLDQTETDLRPGQTSEVPIKFLCARNIVPLLSVGSEFRLWEMGYFADGTVLEILD